MCYVMYIWEKSVKGIMVGVVCALLCQKVAGTKDLLSTTEIEEDQGLYGKDTK